MTYFIFLDLCVTKNKGNISFLCMDGTLIFYNIHSNFCLLLLCLRSVFECFIIFDDLKYFIKYFLFYLEMEIYYVYSIIIAVLAV